MIEISGTIEKIELKTRLPYDPYIGRYSPNTSYLEYFAEVTLSTATDTVYFKTPGVMRTVTCGGPIAIVCFHFPARGNKFLREVGENRVAEAGKPNDNHLELTLREGQGITIQGRLKAEKVSRKGNPYRVVTHVQLMHTEDRVHRVGQQNNAGLV